MLLRVANVNPDGVTTHTDRVLYSAIGVFILIYVAYATIGGATFIDASSNYEHPWWRWPAGGFIALAIIAYDRAVVGRVAISYKNLESDDPEHLLRRPRLGTYLGRGILALLVAVIVTEPLMLDRYRGEIDAWLQTQQNTAAERSGTAGPIARYQQEKRDLAAQDAADDAAVAKLRGTAAGRRAEAERIYQQALDDSGGDGVTGKSGCPAGGYCDSLVQQSRALQSEAAGLEKQASDLQTAQKPGREDRARRSAEIDAQIRRAQQDTLAAIEGNAGFGARTTAMWALIKSDFAGIGIFYLGTALLLIALDCAAIALKFMSHGNAYERAEARRARRRELEEDTLHRHGIKTARTAAEAYAEATASIVVDGIQTAAEEHRLRSTAAREARSRLRQVISATMGGAEQHRPARSGRRFLPQGKDRFTPWPTPEQEAPPRDDLGDDDPVGPHSGSPRWTYG